MYCAAHVYGNVARLGRRDERAPKTFPKRLLQETLHHKELPNLLGICLENSKRQHHSNSIFKHG